MKVLILAAGYGTRLYPLIKDIAKPLVPIVDRPIINHVLDRISPIKGLTEVVVITNNKFYESFQSWAEDNRNYCVPLRIMNDLTETPEDRLGSVGDIHFVLKHYAVNDDLLVIGGDNLFDYSLTDYIGFARQNIPHATIGLYDIGDISQAQKFGVVAINHRGLIVSFEEKPDKPKSSLVAMCCYYLPQDALKTIGQYIDQTSKTDKAGDYIRWLTLEKQVYGFKFEGRWYDIGSIESYQEAQEKFKNKFQ